MLKVENLAVQFTDETVLQDVSFELHPGEFLAVIGPNGAGKSTLVRALSGVVPVKSGAITYNGMPLADSHARSNAKILAVVPQIKGIPPAFTAREVVRLGRTPYLGWLGRTSAEDEHIAEESMRRTDTLQFANRRVDELSGGEYQRVLLARAFAQRTPILLLDEPTTHLDLKYQIELLDQLKQALSSEPERETSALVVLHDLNLVTRYADRVMVLKDGRVEAIGPCDQIMTAATLTSAFDLPLNVVRVNGGNNSLVLPQD